MRWAWGICLTVLAMGVLGYHPYAEDGGIYLAEIKWRLDPGLYPHATAFVTGHLGAGLFGAGVVALVRGTGLSLGATMLLLQGLCVGGLLLGMGRIAGRCYATVEAQMGAVGLVALAMGMPVAGTSLMLMDPYVTARSLVTALVVLGLAGLVEFDEGGSRTRLVLAMGAFALAVAIHPLMGGFGVGSAAVLACLMDGRRRVRLGGVCFVGLLAAMGVAAAQRLAAPEPAEYMRVADTRYYWFLAEWRWYEWLGLVGPMAILGWVGWRGRGTERALARMSIVVGSLGMVIAGLFARQAVKVHAVARLQPLRCFQVVYVVLLLVLGAWLGERVLRRSGWRWGLAALALGVVMTTMQRGSYPASDHLEIPARAPKNQWEEAFLWVKGNTPKDALFALDADYVHLAGEDAQGFRAIAERSALPDYSKDGGQASIRPALTGEWLAGQKAQARLTEESDTERLEALRGTEVSWVVLGSGAAVNWVCPYRTERVAVCRVPRGAAMVAADSWLRSH